MNLTPPRGVKLISVVTSDEMFEAVHHHATDRDILVMCAAVADYKPATVSSQKIKRECADLTIRLSPTRDILASLPRDRQYLVAGFAAETNDLEKNAQKKLRAKNCDIIVANDVSANVFNADTNQVTLLWSDARREHLARMPKAEVAERVLDAVAALLAEQPSA